MKRVRAIVFDIDQTLSAETSWLSLTRDLGASAEELAEIYQTYKAGQIPYKKAKSDVLALWQATGNANKAFFVSLFKQWPLAPGAAEVVARLQKDYKVCLITGSMDLYAEIIARRLNVTDWFANTVLHWDGAGNLTDMDYELDQGKKKLEQFLAFCAANNFDPAECVVIGDGENDIPMFERSGNGIAVGKQCPKELIGTACRAASDVSKLPALVRAIAGA